MAISTDETRIALGQVVRALRTEKGLTQERLGTDAGYRSGAGVSISRLENGQLEPSEARFAGIARSLGLSADELKQLTAKQAGKVRRERARAMSVEDRAARVLEEHDARAQLSPDLERVNAAFDHSWTAFLSRLDEVAKRLKVEAPSSEDAERMAHLGTEVDDVEAEATYGIGVMKIGVAQALATPAGDAALAAATANPSFLTKVAASAATAAVSLAVPSSSAAQAARLALKVPTIAKSSSRMSRNAVVGTIAVTGAAIAVAWLADQRSRKQERELAAKVAAAEVELAETQPNVDALRSVLPEATEILDYVAVHAGHAVGRWDAEIGPEAGQLSSLSPTQQQRYYDFIEVAAAQLAVANIDFEALALERGAELDHALELAQQTLAQSRRIITSHV